MMRNAGTMKAQRDQYRNMFHVDPDTLPALYFETRIAGINLPSEQGTWATLLRRVAGLTGVRRDAYIGDELPNVQAPVLILWGDHDMAPVEAGRAMASRFRCARFVHMPGVGHFPFLEKPEWTSKLITAFLRENP